MPQANIFEKHPTLTLVTLTTVLIAMLYGLCSIKWIKNDYTEQEAKSIKTIVQQYYISKLIDNNIGRFIKLREFRPGELRKERPTRNYIKNIPGDLERKYYTAQVDHNGFIGPSEMHAAPDIKIVFLGGSTTECLYMAETERFPYLVGRGLEKALDKKVNSYNGGVSANESMHSINILINKVLAMQPDMVVMMHNINDLAMLRLQGTYWYQPSLKSHLQTSKNVFTRIEYPPAQHTVQDKTMIQAFTRNLEMFITICKIHGIKPVLMTQANRVENDALYHHFNQIIQTVGEKYQILVIDLANQVPKSLDYFYDSYHYTAKGSALAAEIIVKELTKNV